MKGLAKIAPKTSEVLMYEVERVGGVSHGHREADIDERLLDEADQTDVKDVGDDESAEEIEDGADKAGAELGEMLHEGHAGEFGAVGDGSSDAVDGVEVSHGRWPRWGGLPAVRDRWCGGLRRAGDRCLNGVRGDQWRAASG